MLKGTVIASRYVLQRKLGAGGMGQVWAAQHATTERMLAVKLILPGTTGAMVAKDRFMREARASARIGHPNVIDVFDAGELDDGTLYLAMELLDGVSLGDAMKASPPMLLRDFLVAMADACRGLGAAHAVGIIHRDIKPDNIHLHRERGAEVLRAVVLDFGISKFLDNVDNVATVAGSLLGSPRFMSPEQVRGIQDTDARADVWAIGVLLFRALTGQWPHDASGLTQLCIAIGTQAPASIDQLAPHLPVELRELVKSCLAPLDKRAPDAAVLADELELTATDPLVEDLRVSQLLSDPESGITGDSIRVRNPSQSGSTTLSRMGRPSQPHPPLPVLPNDSGVFGSSGMFSSGGIMAQVERQDASADSQRLSASGFDRISSSSAPMSEQPISLVTPPPMSTQPMPAKKPRGMAYALVGVIALVLLVGAYGVSLLSGNAAAGDQAAAGNEQPAPPTTAASQDEAKPAQPAPAASVAEPDEPGPAESAEPNEDEPAGQQPVRIVRPSAPPPQDSGRTAKVDPPPTPPPPAPPKPPAGGGKPKVVGENLGSGL